VLFGELNRLQKIKSWKRQIGEETEASKIKTSKKRIKSSEQDQQNK